MRILFINHKKKQCGVYQYGIRLFNVLKNTIDIEYIYKEIDSLDEYIALNANDYNAIIYNYHNDTMQWLNKDNITSESKNICIPHETKVNFFDIICNLDPNIDEKNNNYSIPRVLYENIHEIIENTIYSSDDNKIFIESYIDKNIPIFGSFGFGFLNKGFHKIVELINDNYDEAIIKFIIPIADFDPNSSITNNEIKNRCLLLNKKEKIKLLISHNFFSNEEILKFLSLNTLNIFLYDYMYNRGISSTIDYALSVKKPFAISDSYMFRHIYSDKICLYKTKIDDCIKNSLDHCKQYLTKYSNLNLINKFRFVITNIIKNNYKFNIENSNSQLLQDCFVSTVSNIKNGFFLEIGSNHPINGNNTYLLEKYHNWKGLMIEYDKKFEPLYKTHRPNSIYQIDDAQNVNYRKIMDNNNFPTNINYLQIDLDVNNCSTLNTLIKLNETIFDKYKFATVTFEHDIYSGDFFDTRQISRKIFEERGYILIFQDVLVFWLNDYRPFEDWYIHPDLIDSNIILKLKTDNSLNINEIKEKLLSI